MKKQRFRSALAAFALSALLALSGISSSTVIVSHAHVSSSLSTTTSDYLKNAEIKTDSGSTLHFKDFSEDYVAYIFGRTGCYNTRSMTSVMDDAQKSGVSIRKVFMPVDDVDNGIADFTKEHATNLTCAVPGDSNNSIGWDCIRSEGLPGGTLPFLFVLDRNGAVVWASDSYEVDSFKSFWSGKGNNEPSGEESNSNVTQTNDNTVTFEVEYGQTEARSILSMVNSFRTGNDAWYWNSSDTKKEYQNGLQPLDYDYDLEEAAMKRAAEIALYYSHTRPNGSRSFTAYEHRGAGENIAIGYHTATAVYDAWKEDDEMYSGQGHRRNILSNQVTAMAVGHAYVNGTHCWVQEFRSPTVSTSVTPANDIKTMVSVEATSEYLGKLSFRAEPTSINIKVGESVKIPELVAEIQNKGYSYHTTILSVTPDVYVADTSIADISGQKIQGKKAGTTKLVYAVTIAGEGYDATMPITVTGESTTTPSNTDDTEKNNKKVTVDQLKYQLKSDGTASLVGYSNGLKEAYIPGNITINGKEYDVTGIAKGAFKKSSITKLSGGSNLKSIGEMAFKKCTKLTTVDLSTADIRIIGKKAFVGCSNISNIVLDVDELTSIGMKAFNTGSSRVIRVELIGGSDDITRAVSMLKSTGLSSAHFVNNDTPKDNPTDESNGGSGSNNNNNNNNNGKDNTQPSGNNTEQQKSNTGFTLKTGWYKDPTVTLCEYIQHNGTTILDGEDSYKEFTMTGDNEYKRVRPSDGLTEVITVTSETSYTYVLRSDKARMLRFHYKYIGESLY